MGAPNRKRRRPAASPDAREQQMVSLAMDVAEERMRNGTASAQEVTYYLKLGSSREELEQSRLRNEIELLNARVESLASAKRVEDLYSDAMKAFSSYSGHDPEEIEDDYDD